MFYSSKAIKRPIFGVQSNKQISIKRNKYKKIFSHAINTLSATLNS